MCNIRVFILKLLTEEGRASLRSPICTISHRFFGVTFVAITHCRVVDMFLDGPRLKVRFQCRVLVLSSGSGYTYTYRRGAERNKF